MKKGRAPGIDDVCTEMIIAMEEVGVRWIKRLFNICMREGSILESWRTGLIVPIWKGKGDVQDPGKYRGITLLSHVMKVLERILDGRMRKRVEMEIGEEQQGFESFGGDDGWTIHAETAGGEEVGSAG